jgi:hypothetical protein
MVMPWGYCMTNGVIHVLSKGRYAGREIFAAWGTMIWSSVG